MRWQRYLVRHYRMIHGQISAPKHDGVPCPLASHALFTSEKKIARRARIKALKHREESRATERTGGVSGLPA